MTNDDRGMNVLGAALFGAMIGAAAVFLSREENRRKLRDSMDNLMDEGERRMGEVQGKVEDMKEKGKRKLARQLETMKQNLEPENGRAEE